MSAGTAARFRLRLPRRGPRVPRPGTESAACGLLVIAGRRGQPGSVVLQRGGPLTPAPRQREHTRGQRHKLESAGRANERQVQQEAGAATGGENERAQGRTCESQSRWRKMADGLVSDADLNGQTPSVFLSLPQP